MAYIHREIEKQLQQYIQNFPVVAITGPRQSGKSTLVKQILPHYSYVTFDNPNIIAEFYDDPERFMRLHNNHVIFDEAQKVPELFSFIKIAVDEDRQNYGKFILTGSAQFTLLEKISESLAGRVGLLSLLPLEFSEVPEDLRDSVIYRGEYPELVQRNYQFSQQWYASYLETYLHQDVRKISNIGNLRDFQRFIQLLASNTSQILNLTNYANAIGVSVNTIKKWISILEVSYIIFLLPPFYENFGKRIIKSPKVYFYDTGLVAYLTGITSREIYEKGPMAGSLFENYLIAEIIKKELHAATNVNCYYYRTSNGTEIDLIVDRKAYKEYIEIKQGETFKPQMLKEVMAITTKHDKGYLLYNGISRGYTENVSILNYQDYLMPPKTD